MAYQSKAAGTSDASNLGLACVCLYIGYLFLYSFTFGKCPNYDASYRSLREKEEKPAYFVQEITPFPFVYKTFFFINLFLIHFLSVCLLLMLHDICAHLLNITA